MLSAGWNMLGSRGGKVIALGLAQCDSLTHCHLPWAGLSDLGASHVARVRACCYMLWVCKLPPRRNGQECVGLWGCCALLCAPSLCLPGPSVRSLQTSKADFESDGHGWTPECHTHHHGDDISS